MGNRERESVNRTEKPGTGKVIFSRNGNEKDHFPVPVHAVSINSYEINGEVQINILVRGNPNGNSCFPVRRTGTLLVYIYKRECICLFVCVCALGNVRALPDDLGSR